MTAQLSLDYERRTEPLLLGRMRDLVNILSEDGGWMTRRQLQEHGFTDRELRELAENDNTTPPTLFSYPGSPGYKLFRKVTHEEFARCISLRNQGRHDPPLDTLSARLAHHLRRLSSITMAKECHNYRPDSKMRSRRGGDLRVTSPLITGINPAAGYAKTRIGSRYQRVHRVTRNLELLCL